MPPRSVAAALFFGAGIDAVLEAGRQVTQHLPAADRQREDMQLTALALQRTGCRRSGLAAPLALSMQWKVAAPAVFRVRLSSASVPATRVTEVVPAGSWIPSRDNRLDRIRLR
jgi:hypothetical protein